MVAEFNPSEVWYVYILPFIVPAITAFIFFMKKQGQTDANAGLVVYEVDEIKNDIKDMKVDIKDIKNSTSDALRQMDVINMKMKYLERDSNNRKGAV